MKLSEILLHCHGGGAISEYASLIGDPSNDELEVKSSLIQSLFCFCTRSISKTPLIGAVGFGTNQVSRVV